MGCQGTLKLVVYGYITYFFSFKINSSSSLGCFLLLFLSLVAQSGLASEAPTLPHTLVGLDFAVRQIRKGAENGAKAR